MPPLRLLAVCGTLLLAGLGSAAVPDCAGGASPFAEDIQGYLIDLDGTMYNPKGLVKGAESFFQYLEKSGKPFVFLSDTGAKGPLGTQTKFLTPPFNISSKPIPLTQIFTAASATATFLEDHAGAGSRIYLLQSTASFGTPPHRTNDSCRKVIARTVPAPLYDSWDIRTDMTDHEIKQWAAGDVPTFVAACADGKVEDEPEGDPKTHRQGYTDWSFSLLSKAGVLVQNGATFVCHAPDTHNAVTDPEFPGLVLDTPGPGTFQKLLVASTYPAGVNRTFVVGKGGNAGTKYMISQGLKMLQALLPAGSSLDPTKVAMVGDTLDTDILAANRAGIASVLVTQTGVHNLHDLPAYPGIVPTCAAPNVGGLVTK
eukprot:Hpha_TRINITY_DN23748_c0_g1::TRINITY_DN23748_c0_g1_i1::g.93211::m.93211